jgi:hypothetical protein
VGVQDDGQPGGHHGLNVLAAGVDDLFSPHLMRESLSLAVRSVVYTTSASSLTKGQMHYLEAGQLDLAREGAYYLGGLSSHK